MKADIILWYFVGMVILKKHIKETIMHYKRLTMQVLLILKRFRDTLESIEGYTCRGLYAQRDRLGKMQKSFTGDINGG